MKKITYLLCITICLISFKTKAQVTIGDFQKMPVEAKTKLVTDSMKIMLDLTESQYPVVYNENEKSISKAVAIKESSDSRMTKRKGLQSVMTNYKSDMKNILTQQQQEILETKVKSLIAYYRGQAKSMPLVINIPQ